MELLPLDVLKLIALKLAWKDILSFSKVNKKHRFIHVAKFWKDKVYMQFGRDLVVYDNYFCSYILLTNYWMATQYTKGYDTARRWDMSDEEKMEYCSNGHILARYLKHKYPQKYKIITVTLETDSEIMEYLRSTGPLQHNVIYIKSLKRDNRIYFIDGDINYTKYELCTYREDEDEIEIRNDWIFEDFMCEYELDWDNVKWLYTLNSDYKLMF